jgi:hypothetical protein
MSVPWRRAGQPEGQLSWLRSSGAKHRKAFSK